MKKISFICLFITPFIFSCDLNDKIYDYYNDCSEELIDYKTIRLIVQNKEFNFPINTFIAENNNEYKTGLMCRRNLPLKIDGMFFKYKEEQNRGFWMHKTYFPLTVIYFDKSGNSVAKAEMYPCTREFYESKKNFEFRCLEESLNYIPHEKYINVLELKNDYLYIDEINSLGKDEKLKLIIKN